MDALSEDQVRALLAETVMTDHHRGLVLSLWARKSAEADIPEPTLVLSQQQLTPLPSSSPSPAPADGGGDGDASSTTTPTPPPLLPQQQQQQQQATAASSDGAAAEETAVLLRQQIERAETVSAIIDVMRKHVDHVSVQATALGRLVAMMRDKPAIAGVIAREGGLVLILGVISHYIDSARIAQWGCRVILQLTKFNGLFASFPSFFLSLSLSRIHSLFFLFTHTQRIIAR